MPTTPTPTPTPASPTAAQKALARLFFLENAGMNKAKSASEKARKELFKSLEADGVGPFSFETTNYAGDKLRLSVEIGTPDKEWIDVATLKGLVDEATFLKIVTASKKSVEENTEDKSIVVKATKTLKAGGTRNVTVKPATA